MIASLTTPFRQRHPNVRFTIQSRTSIEVRVSPTYAPIPAATEALNAPEPATAGPA